MKISVVSKLDTSKGFKELAKFKKKFMEPNGDFSQVGYEASEVHHVNTRGKKEVVTMSELAYWLHEGTRDGRIPPRPFFDLTLQRLIGSESAVKMKPMVSKLFKGISKSKTAAPHIEVFLKSLGTFIMKETMSTFGSSELAENRPVTVKLKGSDRPLIDGVTTNAEVQLKDAMKVKTSREDN